MRHLLRSILIVLSLLSSEALAASPDFFDAFNRPDGAIGNGWSGSTNAPNGNLVIRNDVVTSQGVDGLSDIYRPIDLSGAVTVSATITQMNGFGGLLDRFGTFINFGNDGSLNTGYGILVYRADQTYNDSTIFLVQNGAAIAAARSTFQFDTSVVPTVTLSPDGSISGSISGSGQTFDFNFGPRSVTLSGDDLEIAQALPDSRASTYTFPTIDNVSVTYGPPASSLFSPLWKAVFNAASQVADFASYGLSLFGLIGDIEKGAASIVTSLLDVVGVVAPSPHVVQTLAGQLANAAPFAIDSAQVALACDSALASVAAPYVDAATASACALAATAYGADILKVAFRLAANDPPDPNFNTVFVPAIPPSPIPLTGACTDLSTAATASPYAMDQTIAWLNAMLVTADRYSSALSANDQGSAALQFGAFQSYSASYATADEIAAAELKCISDTALANGLGGELTTSADEQHALNFLATDPLATDFVNQFLGALGFTGTDTAAVIQESLLNPPPAPFESSADSINALAADLGRTAAVPEPGTLLLFVSGLGVLLVSIRIVRRKKFYEH